MNWLDLAIIGAVAFTTLVGLMRGMFPSVWGLVTLVASTFVAGLLYPIAGLLITTLNPPPNGAPLLGFLFVYLFTTLLVATPVEFFTRGRHIELVLPGCQDHLVGGALGLLQGLAFAQVMLILLAHFPVLGVEEVLRQSVMAQRMLSGAPLMLKLLPPEFQDVVVFFS
jgi:uncharacterized membrane protein required for colicin V production